MSDGNQKLLGDRRKFSLGLQNSVKLDPLHEETKYLHYDQYRPNWQKLLMYQVSMAKKTRKKSGRNQKLVCARFDTCYVSGESKHARPKNGEVLNSDWRILNWKCSRQNATESSSRGAWIGFASFSLRSAKIVQFVSESPRPVRTVDQHLRRRSEAGVIKEFYIWRWKDVHLISPSSLIFWVPGFRQKQCWYFIQSQTAKTCRKRPWWKNWTMYFWKKLNPSIQQNRKFRLYIFENILG